MHPKALSREDLIRLGQFITVKSCNLPFKKLSLTLCWVTTLWGFAAMPAVLLNIQLWYLRNLLCIIGLDFFSQEEKSRIILWFKLEVSFNFFKSKLPDGFLTLLKKRGDWIKINFCIVLSTNPLQYTFLVLSKQTCNRAKVGWAGNFSLISYFYKIKDQFLKLKLVGGFWFLGFFGGEVLGFLRVFWEEYHFFLEIG